MPAVALPSATPSALMGRINVERGSFGERHSLGIMFVLPMLRVSRSWQTISKPMRGESLGEALTGRIPAVRDTYGEMPVQLTMCACSPRRTTKLLSTMARQQPAEQVHSVGRISCSVSLRIVILLPTGVAYRLSPATKDETGGELGAVGIFREVRALLASVVFGWAQNSPWQPRPTGQQPHVAVSGGNVSYQYGNNPWSLFSLLRDHATSPPAGPAQTLQFSIATQPVLQGAVAQSDATVVFLRLQLQSPDDKKALTVPTVFPVKAPPLAFCGEVAPKRTAAR